MSPNAKTQQWDFGYVAILNLRKDTQQKSVWLLVVYFKWAKKQKTKKRRVECLVFADLQSALFRWNEIHMSLAVVRQMGDVQQLGE